MDFFIDNIYTAVLTPLWVFLLILFGKYSGTITSKKTIFGLTLASTMFSSLFAFSSYLELLKDSEFVYESSFNFIQIQNLSFNIGVLVDNLAILFMILVCVISLLVQIYSYSYMKKDRSFPRFYAYLNLFNFSMLGLILSQNLFQMYIFWELVGVSSYLLIGFWYKRPSASKAAKKAFIINRIGDFGLMAAILAISYTMFSNAGDSPYISLPFASINEISTLIMAYTSDIGFILICLSLIIAALAKSAQFPLHTWLSDAMEGPTPVSALIHSATMVAAGIFLIARIYPMLILSPIIMKFITVIGLITALLGAFIAITQTDLKRILAFSTNSQLGLMFLAMGAGAYSAGLFQLTTHAFIKAMLFLCAGIVIHSLDGIQDIKFMGGLRKKLPLACGCFFVGAVALSGLAFSGFYSKESILAYFIENNQIFYAISFIIVGFLTAYYIFRAYFLIFEGEYKGSAKIGDTNSFMNLPVFFMAFFTFIYGVTKIQHPIIATITIILGFMALFIAFINYATKCKPVKLPILYNLSFNKLFFDEVYNKIFIKPFEKISNIFNFIDKYIFDGLVILAKFKVRAGSWVFSKMQTGNVQSYIAYSLAGTAFIFALILIFYMVVINMGDM